MNAGAVARWLLAALIVAGVSAGQTEAADDQAQEERLAELSGLERGRALARLTKAHRSDAPAKAIAYGEEALEIFARTPDVEAEVDTRNEIAWALMIRGDREAATEMAESGRDLARREGYAKGEARALNNLGVVARRWGEPLAAIELFAESMEIYRRVGANVEVAMSLNNLGVVYAFDLADYERALEYQLEALDTRLQLDDQEGLALSYNNLGVVYSRLGNLDRAAEHYTEALAVRRRLGLRHRVAGTLQNLGDLALEQGDLAAAEDYHREALAIRLDIGERTSIAMSLRALSRISAQLGDLDEAERLAGEALAAAESLEAPQETALSLLTLAEVGHRRGELDEASALARRALAIAEEASAKDLVRRVTRELAEIEASAGRYRHALDAFRRFKEVSDEIFDDDRSRRVEILESRYEAERREREIATLLQRQAVQALEIERQRFERNALLAGSLVFAFVLVALFYRHRVLTRLTGELETANRQLEELSTTDALTGLRNRRYLSSVIATDIAASLRAYRGGPELGESVREGDLAVLILDADHFKSVNDTYGHDAGDLVLRQLAELLRGASRASDTVVRWGGEEFLVVSRGAGRQEAAAFAERLRSAVARHEFDIGPGSTIRRTCSVGFAVFPFDPSRPDLVDWNQVVTIADYALYMAKDSGRDAWVGLRSSDQTPLSSLADGGAMDLEAWVREGRLDVLSSRPSESVSATSPGR